LLYGSEFDLGDGKLVALARDLEGWGGLCEFITAARTTKAPKGEYSVGWEFSHFPLLAGCEILFAPSREGFDPDALLRRLKQLRDWYGDGVWIAVELHHAIDDDLW